MKENIKRGDIYYADLSPVVGSEQDGIRPVLIIQNNKGNQFSSCVIVVAITSIKHPYQSTHVEIGTEYGLKRKSYAMVEQIRTIDKLRLLEYIGHLNDNKMIAVSEALAFNLEIQNFI